MGRIRALPDQLANQIAAGEVVERPASALKELVENSLDAGADRLRIILENGGKRLIRVEDNGCGMDRDDCLMALERHATSKLTRAEDLFSIRTLGFRGEALPSIASVSHFSLESRHAESETGTRVEIHGSKLSKVSEISMNPGTTISVGGLFYNIPARKKFLRAVDTELAHMVNLVTNYSFAHVDKAFVLEHNGRKLIDVTPVSSLKERIYQHYGKKMIDRLIPVEGDNDWLTIKGMVSTPDVFKTSRNYQHLFVNGRLVKDKVLTHAIGDAIRGFGEGKLHPIIFLFLEMPSTEVDVNVHPAKTEVKFIHSGMVHDSVRNILREALTSRPLTIPYRFRDGYHAHPSQNSNPKPLPWAELQARQQELPGGGQQSSGPLFNNQGGGRPFADKPRDAGDPPPSPHAPPSEPGQKTPYERFLDQNRHLLDHASNPPEPSPPLWQGSPPPLPHPPQAANHHMPPPGAAPPTEPPPHQTGKPGTLFADYSEIPRPIGQFRDSYILAEEGGNLLLIDQHVAHERILYDQIVASLEDQTFERQALLVPETIELTPHQAVEMNRLLPFIRKFGFDLDPFDGNTFVIRETPTFAEGQNLEELVRELVEKAQGHRNEDTLMEAMIDHFAATKACKAAIKINMRLTMEKMVHLVDTLWHSSSPLFCPHGRPIVLKFSNDEIEKNFHRK